MKKGFKVTLAALACLIIAGAIWWHELNVLPNVVIPKPAPLPSPNAYNYFSAADKLAWYGNGDEVDQSSKEPLARKEFLLGKELPALTKARQGFSVPYADPGNEKLPGADERDNGHLFVFAGGVYAEEGDWNNAMRCELDAVQLGMQVSHGGTSWALFSGDSCQRYGVRPMWSTVDHLDKTQTRSAILRLQTILADPVSLADELEREKALDESFFMGAFRRHNWRGRTFAGPPTIYLSSNKTIMANEISYDDAWIAEVRKPYADKLPLPTVPSDAWHQWRNAGTSDFFQGGPTFGGKLNWENVNTWLGHEGTLTQDDLMLVSLALHAYKLDHGAYPSTLAELTPAYLKNLPGDPFASSGTFRYRLVGIKYLLYSLGPDGQDDGGKPIYQREDFGENQILSSQDFLTTGSKGDIVAGVNKTI